MPVRHLTSDEVNLHVDAPRERVYDLVADITRMGEWSPECHRARWAGGATHAAPGARFKAWNRRRLLRWSNKPTVVAATPGREFAFSRTSPGAGTVVWRYRFEPRDGGTLVTESYEVVRRANPVVIWLTLRLMRIRDREADLRQAMTTTLMRLKAAAEADPS